MPASTVLMIAAKKRLADQLTFAWTAFAAMPAVLDLPREVAGLGLIALVAFPIIANWSARRTLIVADPFVVIGAMWVLAAGLPAVAPWLYMDAIWLSISDPSLETATLWMYRAWAACSLAYWATRCLPSALTQPPAPAKVAFADKMRVAVGVIGLFASIVYVVMTGGQAYTHIDGFAATSTWDQLVHELRQLSKIYVFLFFFARGRGRLLKREQWLLCAVLATFLSIFAASAAKGVAIELIAMWVLGTAADTRRGRLIRELTIGSVAFAALFVVSVLVTAYRIELSNMVAAPSASLEETISVQAAAARRALAKVAAGEPVGSDDKPYDAAAMLDRLAYVSAFATMLDLTSAVSPYENAGATLLTPILALLPRSMMDDKVQFFDSGQFAKLLGWDFGGFSVSLPGSLFWAWGFEGILPAMAFVGAVLAMLARRSESDGPSGLVARVVLMSAVLMLLNVGVYFQAIVISAVRMTIVLMVLQVAMALLLPVPRRRRMVEGSATW